MPEQPESVEAKLAPIQSKPLPGRCSKRLQFSPSFFDSFQIPPFLLIQPAVGKS
jgi:hypothetical protein